MFINTFYDIEEGYLDGRFGIEGVDYEIIQDEIIINSKNIFDDVLSIHYSPLVDLKIDMYKEVLYDNRPLLDDKKDVLNYFMKNDNNVGIIKAINYLPNAGMVESLDRFIGLSYLDSFILNYDSVNPEELIQEYRVTMRAKGFNEILDSLNERIGMKTINNY